MLIFGFAMPTLSGLPREFQFSSASLRQLFSAYDTVDLSCEKVASLIRPSGF
jgi:hypothetical protein